MKKVILTTLLLSSICGFSQDFKFGLKGGLNIASQTSSGGTTITNVIGGNFGVIGEYKISDKFSIQPELSFSMQGAKSTATFGTFSADATRSFNYLNIPVIIKCYALEKFSIQAGPQIGFLISATDKVNSSIPGLPSSSGDSKSSYNSIDFGLNFGLGYDFTENISVSTRYNLGLKEVEKSVPTGSNGSKNKVISFGIEYKF
jgi:opacity protein-like surface antigen